MDSRQTTEAKQNRVYSQRGDDYLIEAQKLCAEDKPKPPVLCPYCGTRMFFEATLEGRCWYECYKCGASAPAAETELDAYAAGMQWIQRPNRCLTKTEMLDRYKQGEEAEPLWVESCYSERSRWMVIDIPRICMGENTICSYYGRDCKLYNVMWRCWIRKPTQKEMEAVPWGGD